MFNPRFKESESDSLQNPWLTFAALHTYTFWKSEIVCSIIPGARSEEIQRTLAYENGFSEGWGISQLSEIARSFNSTLKEAWLAKDLFAVVDDPLERILKLPGALAEDRDGCSTTLLRETGKYWGDYSLLELVQAISRDDNLAVQSHWWCSQELCLLMRTSHYSRIFKANDLDGIKWWLGERGIQLHAEANSSEKSGSGRTPHIDHSAEAREPLRDVWKELNSKENWRKFADGELIELVQDTYREDYNIFNRDP